MPAQCLLYVDPAYQTDVASVEQADRSRRPTVPAAMLAGALAGISEHSVMFPVDAIKVRL